MLSLFFFITKKGKGIENKLLACLLVVFNLQIVYSFSISNYAGQYFLNWHKWIYVLKQASLLSGPLIYFYTLSFLKKMDNIQSKHAFHFLPFAVMIVYLPFYYYNKPHFILWDYQYDLYDTAIILFHNLLYIFLSVTILKNHNFHFLDIYKRLKGSSQIAWLQFILLGFIIVWVINLNSFAVYMIIHKPGWCAYTGSIFALTVFLFMNLVMLILLLKPEVYYVVEKYKNVKISEREKLEFLKRLKEYMETGKAYINPEITLELVAKEISVKPRELSQLINETYQMNFKNFIIGYRMKESMQMLADAKYKELTILEILYKVGFNTKSTFNNQFKLYTSLTPQEYRKKNLKN
jgi:AraC-like DNA-binding protein